MIFCNMKNQLNITNERLNQSSFKYYILTYALTYKLGDFKNSVKYYKLAIEKNPHDEVPLNQIGQLFRELNNLKNASIYL